MGIAFGMIRGLRAGCGDTPGGMRVAILVLLTAGCGTVPDRSGAVASAPAPPAAESAEGASGADARAAVADFLNAVARNDPGAMAHHFGTSAGPLATGGGGVGCALRRMGSWVGLGARCATTAEIELRMALLARLLVHDSYRIGGSAGVVGRGSEARRIEVELSRAGGSRARMPFVVVRADGGRWLVEEVGLDRAQRGRSR